VDQERQLLLLNFALGHLPDKHRVTRENALQSHERASSVGQLLGSGSQQGRVLVLRVLRQGLAFIGLDLRASHGANLRMLGQALATKSVHYCLVLQILPSVFQMQDPESPWLDPQSETA
jgi:hypothetical protein